MKKIEFSKLRIMSQLRLTFTRRKKQVVCLGVERGMGIIFWVGIFSHE